MSAVPTNVVPLNGVQDDLLNDAGPAVDDTAAVKAARQAFAEAADTSCSFDDCLLSVYQAGVSSVLGVPKKARKPRKLSIPPCPHDKIVALFHEVLPELPGVDLSLLNEKRRTLMNARWKWVLETKRSDGVRRAETPEQALNWLRLYFNKVRSNGFLMGTEGRTGAHSNWRCTLDYLLEDRGMQAVIERTTT